jgi:hypothetical protein
MPNNSSEGNTPYKAISSSWVLLEKAQSQQQFLLLC